MINIELLSESWTMQESFSKGQIIMREGEILDDKMYIIKEGVVGIYKSFRKKGEFCVARLSHGDTFGEMELFMEKNRIATVIAEEDVTVLVIDRDHALEFFRNEPEATHAFITALCIRFAKSTSATAKSNVEYENNVSALSDEKAMWEHSANTDPLTGIFNRRFFMSSITLMINNALRENKASYIVLMDLDNFKNINDDYGHNAGDSVLKRFSELAGKSVRSGDLFARYGGEEFIMLISCDNENEVGILVERIREKTAKMEIEVENDIITVTTSIGVSSVLSGNDDDIEKAISNADKALYIAKKEGKNRTVFYKQ